MIVIIGAGISGLTFARNLSQDSIILEKENHIGGLSTQYFHQGYWFDFGGHYFHFQHKAKIWQYLEQIWAFKEYKRRSRVFLKNEFIPYPIQFHLRALSRDWKNKILAEVAKNRHGIDKSLKDFLLRHFGPSLSALFFYPYLKKYYQTDLDRLIPFMDQGSIPIPKKEEFIQGARGERFDDKGYNPMFYYPCHSLRRFIEIYAAGITPQVRLTQEVKAVDIKKREVYTSKGRYQYDKLVTTIPLIHFLRLVQHQDDFPPWQKLQHVSTLVINIVLKRRRRHIHWVYLPQEASPFHRFGYYPRQNQVMGYLEVNYRNNLPFEYPFLQRRLLTTLKELGVIHHENEILVIDYCPIPVSYVLFDHNWLKTVPPLLEKFRHHDIYTLGRFGSWRYTSMSDDINTALDLAQMINTNKI